jgi:AraC-like DNA-binding protein
MAQSFGNCKPSKEAIDDIQNDYMCQIDYEKLSKEMGLHHSYLDFIKNNQLNNASKQTLEIMRDGFNIKKIGTSLPNIDQIIM